MKQLGWIVAAIIVAGTWMIYSQWSSEPTRRSVTGLPWQIELLPGGGSRVFGVVPGESTLGEAREALGREMELGIIARPNEIGTLEAYYPRYTAGVLNGKLVLETSMDPGLIEQMQASAADFKYSETGRIRYIPRSDHAEQALQALVESMTFIPSANFDEAVALQRFGEPTMRVPGEGGSEHLLYPELGLDLILNPDGKEILQYVAPRDFDRLRAPLEAQPDRGTPEPSTGTP